MPKQSELRPEEIRQYSCEGCGQNMPAPLPKGLEGKFWHVQCHRTAERRERAKA